MASNLLCRYGEKGGGGGISGRWGQICCGQMVAGGSWTWGGVGGGVGAGEDVNGWGSGWGRSTGMDYGSIADQNTKIWYMRHKL